MDLTGCCIKLVAEQSIGINVISQLKEIPAGDLSLTIDRSSHFLNSDGEITSQVSLTIPKPVLPVW